MNAQKKDDFLVLVADDSHDDRRLVKLAMRRATRMKIIAEMSTGGQVIDYLDGRAHFSDRERFPLPDLLLMDLKMPQQDGFEVLEWLHTQPFEKLTVVVLTDSMNPAHIKRALDLGADLFQVKPKATHDREAMILALEEYLLRPAHSPAHHPHSAVSAA